MTSDNRMPSELNHYFVGIYPSLDGRGSGAGAGRRGKDRKCKVSWWLWCAKDKGDKMSPNRDDVGDEDRTAAAAAAAADGFRFWGRALTGWATTTVGDGFLLFADLILHISLSLSLSLVVERSSENTVVPGVKWSMHLFKKPQSTSKSGEKRGLRRGCVAVVALLLLLLLLRRS